MKEFVLNAARVAGEIVVGHMAAILLLTLAAGFLARRFWDPAKKYFVARAWLERAVAVGIRNFFPSRESYAADRRLAFSDYLQSAKRNLRYFGHWLAFTIEQNYTLNTLCKMAESGKAVQLILLDPELPDNVLAMYARYLGDDLESLRAEIRTTWTKLLEARDSLSAHGREFLGLRAHQEFIPYSAFWFDRDQDAPHILIDMKLYGASRKDAYGLELHPVTETSSRYPSLYQRYADSLARLEAKSAPA